MRMPSSGVTCSRMRSQRQPASARVSIKGSASGFDALRFATSTANTRQTQTTTPNETPRREEHTQWFSASARKSGPERP